MLVGFVKESPNEILVSCSLSLFPFPGLRLFFLVSFQVQPPSQEPKTIPVGSLTKGLSP